MNKFLNLFWPRLYFR